MPTINNSPRIGRVFVQTQSGALRAINQSSGTWVNTGAKILRVTANGIQMTAGIPKTPVPWKTGTRSNQPGILGRKAASWSLTNLPVVPSGTAGTAPDMDPLMLAIMGVSTNTPATKQAYTFSDTVFNPFSLFYFQHGVPTLTQRLQFGCTVTSANFTLNGNVFDMGASGFSVYQLDSDFFASEPDTIAKGGLTTYPVEPSSPTIVGNIMTGFGGIATFDGTAMDATTCPMRNCSVGVQTGNQIIGDTFNDAYGAVQCGGARGVSVSAGFVDMDAASLINLKNKAKANTPMDITLQVGTVAGNIVKFILKSVTLELPAFNETDSYVEINFGQSMAHGSAIGSIDDLSIEFS